MDPTCGLTDKIRDLMWDLIWKHILYLVHYHRNIEQLDGRLDDLNCERSALQHRIDQAKNNGEQIFENVCRWLGEVDKISEQVHQLHRESEAKLECGITSCPNPWLRCKLSKRAETIAQAAVEIVKKNFDRVGYPLPLPLMLEVTNKEGNEGIGSRFPIVYQIIEELRNPSVNMIGLCGLGGVGKTTIAKEVAKNQKIFEKVIVATVSQELNIENIQGQIAEKLSMQLGENDKEVRAFRLCERLKQEKNMLLILDDLWEELDLGKIGIRFVSVENYSKKNEGCKILLTSRNKTLLSHLMKCQKIVEVGVLSEDEALELFKKIAEVSTHSSSPELISIATDVVRKCGGLPLAIATIAKALRNKDINEWKDALARLSHPLRRNVTGIKEVDNILKWSYDRLNSLEHKQIFLLSAMLSHDPSIEDLLMYSVGLDILDGMENIEDARVGVSAIVSKLKSLNLFLDSISSHHVTIHDVFRDVALSIASNEFHVFIRRRLKEWPDENMLQGCKGICLQESDISDLPEELHGSGLQFFLLNNTKRDLNIPSMLFKSLEELKVLAFTNVNFSSLSSLIFLHKLKALCLHSCLLEDIAEVRSLKNLKVLSLAYSEIQRLPIELAELTSLQMLNLSHCSQLEVIPQKLLSRLKKLEVLHMGNSFNQWKVEESGKADENASLDELIGLPISSLEIHIPNLSMLPENLFLKMNLRRYKIFIGERWTWWQSNYGASKILKLELESSINLTARLRNLSKGVEDLHLYGSNGQENVLYNLGDVSGFPCLRHLQIESNDDIKYIVLNSAHHEDAFPILESLELKNLEALDNLCEGPNAIVFRQLHTLKMENLPALTEDFSIKDSATKNASNKIFKSLFNKVLLPKLEILELSYLNSLISLIWDDQLLHDSFNNLKTLKVVGCGFVKLVPLHVLKSLNNLEKVEVNNCYMLEIVFDFEDLNDYYKETDSSLVVVPLKKLELRNLPKLKNVWSEHYQGNVSFLSLRSVDVFNCKSLTSIFPASIAKGMLCDLEVLRIENCGVDVIVAKDQVSESVAVTFGLPRLTTLWISALPNLRNFYPQKHTLEWPHLNWLAIQYCDELEIFEKEVSGSSEIYKEENMLHSKYPLLPHDKVIGNLERLTWQGEGVEKIGSGQFLMHQFPKLKQLHLSLEKERSFRYWERSPNLRELKLSGDFEKALGGDNVVALIAHFPQLTLEHLSIMGSLSPSLVSSPNLTHLNVKGCYGTTLMTSSIARSLVNLTHLSISNCYQIEEIITKHEGEDVEDREIFFRKLEFLELYFLPALKRFCGYNYTFKFLLLDQLIIKECPKFKIFSPGVIKTPSLKSVQKEGGKYHEIWDNDLNKTLYHQGFLTSSVVVLDEDDAIMIRNDQFPADCFPKVEILQIEGFVEEWVTFPYTLLERFPNLNELHVNNCSFRDIFPSHAPSSSSFHNLIVLEVSQCHQLIYLMTISTVKSLVNLGTLEIDDCEKLEEIIRKEPNKDVESGQQDHSTSFHNLTELKVSKCHQLVYLVTTSTVKSLVNLETLEIDDCEKLEEIVRNDTDEDVEGGITFNGLSILKLTHLPLLKTQVDQRDFNIEDRATNTRCTNILRSTFSPNQVLVPKFGFPRLTSLRLSSLPNLRNFYPQKHTLEWPHLNQLSIQYCDELEIFEKEMSGSSEIYEEENMLHSKYPLLSHNEVIGNLERLTLQGKQVEKIGSGQFLMYHFPKLKQLHLSLEKKPSFTFWEWSPNLGELKLSGDFEKALGGDNVAALTARFPILTLEKISIMQSLSPSLVSSPNLTHLNVKWCNGTTLMTSSIARSLVHLTHLSISHCIEIKEIITKQEGEDDEDREIFFRKLEYLKLDHLPRLKRFCGYNYTFRFPLLKHVTIRECPQLTMFCPGVIHAPRLQDIQVDPTYTPHKVIWMTDLNNTIQHLLTYEEVISTTYSMAINAKNITRIVDVFPKATSLYVESFTDEGVAFPYSSLEKFPKLISLYVEHCSFEEIFPSQDQIIDFMGKISQLKGLNIAYMDKLKSIWKDDSRLPPIHQNLTWLKVKSCCSLVKFASSSASFQNLQSLFVSGCHQLIHLVTTSTAKSLVSLRLLEINDCKRMEEIVMNETNEDVQGGVTFNQLWNIKLTDMPSLKMFSSQSNTFKFPELTKIKITGCPEMKDVLLRSVGNTKVV